MARCKADLATDGMFDLPGFVHTDAIARYATDVGPRLDRDAHTHRRNYDVYFLRYMPGLSPDGRRFDRSRPFITSCGGSDRGHHRKQDLQLDPLADFLAAVMEMPKLYLMKDPLGKVNIIAYRAGEELNWHFDRSQFTASLLIQAPNAAATPSIAAIIGATTIPIMRASHDCCTARTMPSGRCR